MASTYSAPLSEVIAALRTDERSAADYVDERCDRIEAVDPEVRAFLPERDRRSRLREAAATLEARHPEPAGRPPLYGVPIGVKDIFHVEGFPTKAGSEVPPEALAGPEADVVRTLREAGALVLGKTVTTEFAYFEPGPTRNPHDRAHTPGGSSSGSAAAVAAGFCPLALGSQTIGSVIRPAAFCGIVGYKPTYGRIPIGGVLPVAPSVDHVGLFTQDIAGMRAAAAVCCHDWVPETASRTARASIDDAETDADRPVLGVPEGPYLEQASRDGLDGFATHRSALEAGGYEVRRIDAMEDIDAINDRHETLVAAETALSHDEWYPAYGDRYAAETVALIEEGREASVGALADARVGRGELGTRLTERMDEEGIDLWICPAAPGPAPEGIDDTGDPVMNLPWTYTGMPAVSLPAGDHEGLPLGVQCVGRPMADERLLAWADGLQATLDAQT